MVYVLLILIVLAAVIAPQLWVRWVMTSHAADRPDFPGTGGELARHLLDRAGLETVTVERLASDRGDHYDPKNRAVRLSQANHDGRSITAVAVAAHEVSHALQDAERYFPLTLRTRLTKAARRIEVVGSAVLIASPILLAVTRNPVVMAGLVAAGLFVLSIGVLLHLVTLPVELDASFKRALPILEQGRYLEERDMPAAKSVLRAAAFTYVAATLISLLNVARWLRVLRF